MGLGKGIIEGWGGGGTGKGKREGFEMKNERKVEGWKEGEKGHPVLMVRYFFQNMATRQKEKIKFMLY